MPQTKMPDRPPPQGQGQAERQPRSAAFRISALALAVLLVAAGTLYFTGAFDAWRDGRALDRACGGIIPQEELPQLTAQDGRLSSDEAWTSSARDNRSCTINTPDREDGSNAELTVSLSQGRPSHQLLSDLERSLIGDPKQAVSPIGNGWSGVMNVRTNRPRATVVMPCGKTARDDLVVNLLAHSGPYDRDGEQRARLARVATRTAANAAEQAGCKAKSGKPVKRVTGEPIAPEATVRNTKRPGKATGTCAGVNAATLETAADPLAPVEDCFVVAGGDVSYRLSAYYGPFVQNGYTDTGVADRAKFAGRPTGAANGLHWTSASCPGQHGPAFFVAAPLSGDSEARLPADTLKEFAARSAQAHGCANPA